MQAKSWYASKTIWFNLVVFAGILAQALTNQSFLGIDPKLQAEAAAVINFVLRFVTTSPIK